MEEIRNNRKREQTAVKYEEFTNHAFAQRLHYELRSTYVNRTVTHEFMTLTSNAKLFSLLTSGNRVRSQTLLAHSTDPID